MSCCCDPPIPKNSEYRGDCSKCTTGMPKCWEFAVAGVTNGTCFKCSVLNGVFIVRTEFNTGQNSCDDKWRPSTGNEMDRCRYGCEEREVEKTPNTSEDCESQWANCPLWRFGFSNTDNKWWLISMQNFFGSRISYWIAGASFDCNGPNVLSLITSPTPTICLTLPSTVTIEPVLCP